MLTDKRKISINAKIILVLDETVKYGIIDA